MAAGKKRRPRTWCFSSARLIAQYTIEIEWWKELGQFRTWLSMIYYSTAPLTAATLLAFAALWVTQTRAPSSLPVPGLASTASTRASPRWRFCWWAT